MIDFRSVGIGELPVLLGWPVIVLLSIGAISSVSVVLYLLYQLILHIRFV